MLLKLLRAAAIMAVAGPTIAFADPVYVDPQPYQVDSKYPYVVYPSSYQLDDNYSWETPTYPFDPSQVYFPQEQEVIIDDELARTGGSLTFDSATGAPVINISQGAIPEASQTNVPPPVEHLPTADGAQTSGTTYNKSYSRADRFGNGMFGAGYALNASITSTDATIQEAKRVEAFAEGKVYATAFNREQELVRARAEIHGQQGGANSGSAALYAMGQQIWSKDLTYTFEPPPIQWDRTFFSISKRFMVGPVPINVTASISGGAKISVKGEITPTVARLTALPGGWANASASAAVDIFVAAFGVRGNLTLINVTLPAVGELFWPLCTINWTLKTELKLNTISGNLELFAKVNFVFFSKTWTVTIARWSGLTYNWSLLNQGGSKDLGICMSLDSAAAAQ